MNTDNHSRQVVKKKEKDLAVMVVAIIMAVTLVSILGFVMIKPPQPTVQGQVYAEEIRISGALPGRVEKIYVNEGDRVTKGDTLVKIYSSLMEAKLMQAKAMEQVASATNKKVDSGTRDKIIDAAREVWQQAVAASSIAQKTYQRMERLFAQGVISEQRRDEAEAAYEAASAAEKAALSQYELAKEGAQKEDKEASAAMLSAAKGGVDEVDAFMDDTYLTAPEDGVITEIYPRVSELVATGAPMMSLQKDDLWIEFNVKETMLREVGEDSVLKVYLPALDKTIEAKVFYIKDMGTYANWQATKATGDYDVRTFRVKARPNVLVEGLRPGMSAVLR